MINLALLRELTNYELERSRANREKQIKRLTKEIKVIDKILATTRSPIPTKTGPAPQRKRKASPLAFKKKESYDVPR